MKSLLLSAFVALCLTANATNYYISTNGNDANNGTSPATSWKSLNKLNAYFSSLSPGDNVLLNRGDVFYGSISPNKSGTAGSPITIGAYGTGANPVVTGFTTVSAWSNLGGNIWESTSSISTLPYTNIVVINGVNTPMGRYPNTGYLQYQSHAGNNQITSSGLTGSPNWTGAELATFVTTFTMGRDRITSQSGGTLNFTANAADGSIQYNNQGFFIQNDIKTLDAQNEWYYNPSTKKLAVYSAASPTNVQVPTINALANIYGHDYITLDGIDFQGSDSNTIEVGGSKHVVIQNCNISFSGITAIHGWYAGNSTGLLIQNCTINNIGNNGIDLCGDFDNATIQNNTVKNCGNIPGMGGSGEDNGNGTAGYGGIYTIGLGTMIQNNIVDSVGYKGIYFFGNNSIVQNNYIHEFCRVLSDGGGIYTWNGWPQTTNSGMKILNNIIINGHNDSGIYLDDYSNGIEVRGNSVANCYLGIFLHNNWNIQLLNNTTYNSEYAGFQFSRDNTGVTTSNITSKHNTFFARTVNGSNGQRVVYFSPLENLLPAFTSDSNYYARPIDDNLTFDSYYNGNFNLRNLAQWQTVSGQDAHSHTSPKAITDVNDLRFEYNATSSDKTISLGANYIDVSNTAYNGTITLAPYTSAVLIKNGATSNIPPVANAGADQNITLPTDNASINGSATDTDGTIVSYAWTKISGPSAENITNANIAATTTTSMVEGVYQFELKVTDNNGASGKDTMQVTVHAAISLLPAVNPANTVSGLDYSYYEASSYNVVPDFSTLTPVKTGNTATINISLANRAEVFAFNFTGFINVPVDGQYTLYTNSDDGSNLYIDNVLVVNNDGLHGALETSGTIGLQAGKHAISVGYFQQTGGEVLTVSYAGPGITKQVVPASLFYRDSKLNRTTYTPGRRNSNQIVTIGNNNTGQNITSVMQVSIKAYPNPFTNSVKVNITGEAGDYNLILVDVSGRILWTKTGIKSSGTFQELINTSSLQKGFYFLRVIQNNNISVVKLEK